MTDRKNRLYIVGTPIGNLEDITLRAIRVLKEVGLIAAEDTRVTRRLLDRHGIDTPLTSYHEHNKLGKLRTLLDALTQKDVALVSDAGMPGINDPGFELVRAASEAGFEVISIPGASALTASVSVSGLPMEQFVYLGFLPSKKSERSRLLKSLVFERRALVALETPHRLKAGLQDILETLGDRQISVCRELTKIHEEVFRGTVRQAIDYFVQPRGEFTLVIEGGSFDNAEQSVDVEDAAALISQMKHQGARAREAVSQIAEITGLPRREVYRLWLDTGEQANKGDNAG